MSKNRNTYKQRVRTKRQEVNGKLLPGAMMIPLLVVAALLCIGYLWLCSRNEDIGKSIKALEADKRELGRRVENEEFKWANATAPDKIMVLLRRHNLKMILPGDKSVARITRPTEGKLAAGAAQAGDLAKGEGETGHD